jgi:hypothetical protein
MMHHAVFPNFEAMKAIHDIEQTQEKYSSVILCKPHLKIISRHHCGGIK